MGVTFLVREYRENHFSSVISSPTTYSEFFECERARAQARTLQRNLPTFLEKSCCLPEIYRGFSRRRLPLKYYRTLKRQRSSDLKVAPRRPNVSYSLNFQTAYCPRRLASVPVAFLGKRSLRHLRWLFVLVPPRRGRSGPRPRETVPFVTIVTWIVPSDPSRRPR